MTPEEYITLFEKYRNGACSPEEEAELLRYQDAFQLQNGEEDALGDEVGSRIYGRIIQSVSPGEVQSTDPVHIQSTNPVKITRFRWQRWAAAAAILFMLGAGVQLLLHRQQEKSLARAEQPSKSPAAPKPIKPGTNTATLTLANGSVITLDDAPEGVLAQTGQTAITKGKGLLAYAAQGNSPAAAMNAINTMHVPRGGQYAVTLSDGTRVWLNSESSLTYPEVFTGPERKVILTGEAYFEVSKNEQQPFTVQTTKATIQVLGTSFNMSAYNDESTVKATLVNGSIRLSADAASTLLTPGEQGIIRDTRPGIEKKRVNTAQEIAWKAGYFVFRNSTIQDIMRQIGRWYDVEVEYRGAIPTGTFGGTYSRNKDIAELLKGLELTGLVHFTIEGRKLIVMI